MSHTTSPQVSRPRYPDPRPTQGTLRGVCGLLFALVFAAYSLFLMTLAAEVGFILIMVQLGLALCLALPGFLLCLAALRRQGGRTWAIWGLVVIIATPAAGELLGYLLTLFSLSA